MLIHVLARTAADVVADDTADAAANGAVHVAPAHAADVATHQGCWHQVVEHLCASV